MISWGERNQQEDGPSPSPVFLVGLPVEQILGQCHRWAGPALPPPVPTPARLRQWPLLSPTIGSQTLFAPLPPWLLLWAPWSGGRCPCWWQGGWNQMIFKVSSNPNHSMILWFPEIPTSVYTSRFMSSLWTLTDHWEYLLREERDAGDVSSPPRPPLPWRVVSSLVISHLAVSSPLLPSAFPDSDL